MQAAARRNAELWLLILALMIGVSAVALVALARTVEAVSTALPLVLAVVVGYVIAHVVIRKTAPQADHLILPLVAALNLIGLAAVYRISPERYGVAQVMWIVVGLALFAATLLIVRDVRVLARYKYLLGLAGVGLLLFPLTPLGKPINGARLWVELGPLTFQPGELAKIALVIFFAAYLAERKELLAIATRRFLGMHFPDIKHFGPLLVMWGLSLAVMFYEKDLGSSLLFFSIFLVMLYIATARVAYVVAGSALFVAGAYVGYRTFTHVQRRVEVWLNVFDERLIEDAGFQLDRKSVV